MEPVLIGEVLSVLLFLSALGALSFGFPVAFSLAGVGLAFMGLGWVFGVFDLILIETLASRYFGVMVNETLVAVPLFVFMGFVLERTGIAEELFITVGQLFGRVRGGLGVSVVLVGALLAASTGIVGATVVAMTLVSLPAMIKAGYDPKLATGVICASGTLGQIIPPSTVLIFVGDIMQGANTTAQLAMGNFAPDPVSVGDLFAGALLPGLILAFGYMIWVLVRAWLSPASAPAMVMTDEERASLLRRAFTALIPPLALIVAVLGSIVGGIATPTESGAVGAVGAVALALMKRRFDFGKLGEVVRNTAKVSSMIFVILFGASVFSLAFRGLGGEHLVEEALAAMPGGWIGATIVVMLVMFVLGFFLDTFEIIFVVVPIAAPILIKLGVDPVWLGVMIGVNLQTSFLTPPFGFSLFYLRGVAPDSVRTADIYRGIIPFVGVQVAMMGGLMLFPALATWLPDLLF